MFSFFKPLVEKILKDIGDNYIFPLYIKYFRKKKEEFYQEMLNLPYIRYGDYKDNYYSTIFWGNKINLLNNDKYKEFIKKIPLLRRIKKYLLNELINKFEIYCYNDADRFLILVCLLHLPNEKISRKNIVLIFKKLKDNNQSEAKLIAFLNHIKEKQTKLITDEMNKYLKDFKK